MSKNKRQPSSKNGSMRANVIPEFVRNVLFQRWAIVIIMSLVLTLLLSPHIYFASHTYKLGSIATKDIKADHDFLVEDRASTGQRRLDAIKKAQPVFDLDRDMPLRIGMTMAKAFLGMAEMYTQIEKEKLSSEERKTIIQNAKKEFESTLDTSLTKNEFETLSKYMFSIDICNNNVKLIYSLYNRGAISPENFSGLNTNNGIIIRNIKTQQEDEKHDLSSILTMMQANSLIVKDGETILKDESRNVRQASISLIKKVIKPNLTFANNATEKRKQSIMDSVNPVFYKVQRNEMIVREGEKISAVHLDKLAVLYAGADGNKFQNISIFIGMFLTIMLFSIILFFIFTTFIKPRTDNLNTDILMLGVAAILQVLLTMIGVFISKSINHAFPLIPVDACLYAIPFASATMLVVILINRDVGFIFSIFSAFLISFLFEDKTSMFLYSLLGSMVAAFKIAECKERSAFFKTGLFVGLVNIAIIICISLLSNNLISTDTFFNLSMGIAGGVFSAAVVFSIVPLFESLFGYTTDIKLLELANLNRPIFQKMIMVAPGTYHHSIVVASMVEAAAETINANSLLAKVSAYYHDIGKMKKSLYFIENQRGIHNKLDKLSPKMSSLVIISHVKEGYELAKEYKLGKTITDIIKQHHGTRLVGFFYDKAQKDQDPSVRSIPEGDFRYPGPKPQTKEAGLVLLGDVVEASSRALKNPTPSRIKSLIEDRINQIVMEGQLNDCELTFHDLSKIAENFTRTLNGIFHQRIDYPEPIPKERIDYPESIPKETNGKREKSGNSHRKPTEDNKDRYPKSSTGSQ